MRNPVLLLILSAGVAWGQTPDALTDWMNGIAQRQLSEREAKLRAITGAPDARARQATVRSKILQLLGDFRITPAL